MKSFLDPYCSARTRTELGYLENTQRAAFVPLQASSRTRHLRSPHANADMKQYECDRTEPLFCAGHDHG
jgi:hypothetical protein